MRRQRTSTKPVLFLFDSDHPNAGTAYGSKCDSAFLCALRAVDQKKATCSLVLRGDLLLASLSYKPSRVSSQNWKKSQRSGLRTQSSSAVMSADKQLFKLLIGDLCDAFESQWHTLDLVKMPELLMHLHTLYCIFLPSLPSRYRSTIDDRLRQCPYYLGAVVPDLSNPLHRELIVDSLFRDAFIEGGDVHMPLGIEGYLDGDFHGADKFSEHGIVALPMDDFAERSPSIPTPGKLSVRAMVTLTRLQNRRALDIHERLASQLSSLETRRNVTVDYDWDLRHLPNAPAIIYLKERDALLILSIKELRHDRPFKPYLSR